ncbi:hypothetical protein LV164_005110 [Aspergillus fumigatus]|nr:hypothetical protein KXX57_000049 [Aspergillus fumigatus]KAH1987527.1 hypothetical protein KXW88_002839 [Aspergillus fumigatus]KAH2320162.1 hypothetical protein KXV47_002505 [Aspergillus fumigatus]KAH3150592.1 hypothetical protein KXW18_000049 [Aspergillus fumigatus]KAH3278557.1 hypothetical protein KXW55_001625 [Aspergillus fumigatus]
MPLLLASLLLSNVISVPNPRLTGIPACYNSAQDTLRQVLGAPVARICTRRFPCLVFYLCEFLLRVSGLSLFVQSTLPTPLRGKMSPPDWGTRRSCEEQNAVHFQPGNLLRDSGVTALRELKTKHADKASTWPILLGNNFLCLLAVDADQTIAEDFAGLIHPFRFNQAQQVAITRLRALPGGIMLTAPSNDVVNDLPVAIEEVLSFAVMLSPPNKIFSKEVKNENHENAVLLYTRGVEPDQPWYVQIEPLNFSTSWSRSGGGTGRPRANSADEDAQAELIQTHAEECLRLMLGQSSSRLGVQALDDLGLPPTLARFEGVSPIATTVIPSGRPNRAGEVPHQPSGRSSRGRVVE